MSFGGSPSDFFTLGQIVFQLYRRFKSAVPQFNDLHDDLCSAEVALNIIEQFFQTEENIEQLLSLEQQAKILPLVHACKSVFLELRNILENNSKLGSQNPGTVSRLKWSRDSVEYHARRLHSNLLKLTTCVTPMILQRSCDNRSRQLGEGLQRIEVNSNELSCRLSRTEKLLASMIDGHVPISQDGQDLQVLPRVSAILEEGSSRDLAKKINIRIPKELGSVEIVVSVLLSRAQEESASERVYAEAIPSSGPSDAGPPKRAIVSVQLDKSVKRFCPPFCPCSCHPTRKKETLETLVHILGKAFLRYCRIPQSTGPCNMRGCQKYARRYARFTYIFPSWMISRLVSVNFTGDPLMVVRTLRLVPTHSDSLRLCSLNEVKRFRLLFEENIASPFEASVWDGRSLLHIAVNTMALESCRFLIEQGAPSDFEDQYGATPSDMAWIKILGKQGDEESLDVLKGLFPDEDPFLTFKFGETHKSVFGMGGRGPESLYSSEIARINDLDSFGITPLSWAARRGDDKSLVQLLARKADPNIRDIWGMAPIHFASKLSNPESVKKLVDYGADVNLEDKWGRNAFHYMTITCSGSAFLKPIIEAKIDINHLEYWGKPPIHVAAVFNNHRALKHLLDNGAMTTYFDADNDSIIFEAVHHNSHEVLKILLDANANVRTVNRWGYTILHMAAIYGDETTMEILHGIELDENCLCLRSTDGLTPAQTFDKRAATSESLDNAFTKLLMSTQVQSSYPNEQLASSHGAS